MPTAKICTMWKKITISKQESLFWPSSSTWEWGYQQCMLKNCTAEVSSHIKKKYLLKQSSLFV